MKITVKMDVIVDKSTIIKHGKRILKFGDTELGFLDKELIDMLNERLSDGVKIEKLKVLGVSTS